MTRNRNKVAAGIAVGAVAVGAMGVGVAAKFTESATTSGTNSVTAATGKMTLSGSLNTGVVVTDIVPGDTVTRLLSVTNSPQDTGAGAYGLGYVWEHATISIAFTNSTAGVGGTKFEAGANPLTIAVTDLGPDFVVGGGDDRVVSNTTTVGSQANVELMRNSKDRWLPNETRTYQVALTFPEAADNAYEGAHAEFSYTVNATQRSGHEAEAYGAGTPSGDVNSQVDNFNVSADVLP